MHRIKQKEQEIKAKEEQQRIKQMAHPNLVSGTKSQGNIDVRKDILVDLINFDI